MFERNCQFYYAKIEKVLIFNEAMQFCYDDYEFILNLFPTMISYNLLQNKSNLF